MSDRKHGGLLEAIEEHFGERMKGHPEQGQEGTITGPPLEPVSSPEAGVLAVVSPMGAQEVELLAQLCARHSVPLVPEGAGTVGSPMTTEGAVLVRFGLMNGFWPPEHPDHRVLVEPGISWLELEEQLGGYGRSAPVYPTSAPRATVGGWLASDGIGVGSYEFGWLSENVLAASVVTSDGGRHEIAGPHLVHVLRSGGRSGIVVAATLRTRAAGVDTPFAVNFDSREALAEALVKTHSQRLPVWHLGFQNAAMARSGASGVHALMFGSYPAERSARVEENLHEIISDTGGTTAASAEAHRVWGSRFFPVSPAHEAPAPGRALVSVESLEPTLSAIRARLGEVAILGSLARDGEVLLLVFDFDGDRPLPLAPAKLDRLLDVVSEFGGSDYRTTTS